MILRAALYPGKTGMAELTLFYIIHNSLIKIAVLEVRKIHTYCLFCETQKCKAIASVIEHSTGIRCIFPEIIQRKWTKGICEEQHHPWLPGYIFLYSDEQIIESLRIPGVIRMLGNGELQGSDLAFATMLYDRNGILGTIQLLEVGQYCTISDPLWHKIEGKVVKIDRGRKRCCIEFNFDAVRHTIWLGYDLICPVADSASGRSCSVN